MGTVLVFDWEADGLLNEVTKQWCAVFENFDTGEVTEFPYGETHRVKDFLLSQVKGGLTLACHNVYGYDMDLMRRFNGIDYRYNIVMGKPVTIIDTLDMSRRLSPDRKLPPGCPTHVWCPVSKRKKPVGPHGLEAWGYRVANKKPVVGDWRHGNPDLYLHRCKEDVVINVATLRELIAEDRKYG